MIFAGEKEGKTRRRVGLPEGVGKPLRSIERVEVLLEDVIHRKDNWIDLLHWIKKYQLDREEYRIIDIWHLVT